MVYSKIKELADARAAVESLEQSIAEHLAGLPSTYGFASMDEFIIAIRDARRGNRRSQAKPVAAKRRKRTKLTDSIRAKVGKLVRDGKSGSYIAKALGISLPSVHNIKKALGLVKSSKKPAGKPKRTRAPAKGASKLKVKAKRAIASKAPVAEKKTAEEPAKIEPAPAS